MATRITSSSFFLIHPAIKPIKKASKRVLMLAKKDPQNTSSSLIRVGSSSIKMQKVFEDKTRGIVCYLDDNGEITCEGVDEGPRFLCSQREKQDIVHLLERNLLQVTDGGKVK